VSFAWHCTDDIIFIDISNVQHSVTGIIANSNHSKTAAGWPTNKSNKCLMIRAADFND